MVFFVYFFSLQEFKSSCHGNDSKVKPLIFISVDGGPDEALKTANFSIMDKSVFEIQCIYMLCWFLRMPLEVVVATEPCGEENDTTFKRHCWVDSPI